MFKHTEYDYDALCTLAKSIAEHLPGWFAEVPSPRAADNYPPRHVYLGRETDKAGIALAYTWNQPGRVDVSGRYPPEASNYPDRPSITLAANRPAEKLANEITRRFLPAYIVRWEQAQGEVIRLRLAEVRVQYTAEVCAMAVGLPLEQIRYDGTPRIGATLYTSVGKLTVEYNGTVRLQTNSIQPTVALEILKCLMEANAE